MTVAVPYEQKPPVFRVRTAERWQGAETAWVTQLAQGPNGTGLRVRKFSRRCLPQIGTAVLSYEYGVIDGKTYGPEDLALGRGYEVRIEKNTGTTAVPVWVTVWWGEATAIRGIPSPGASTAQGTLEIHCRDALHRLSRWKMNNHQFATPYQQYGGDPVFARGCYGHPGYNSRKGLQVVGNKYTASDPLGFGYDAHTWAGSANAETWTDSDAVEHALNASMPIYKFGDLLVDLAPRFTLSDESGSLAAINVWDIPKNMDCLRFLTMVLDRRRGRGNSYLDWTVSGDAITPLIRVRASNAATLTETLPSGAAFSVPGSDSVSNTIEVDLIGDHRLVDDRFELSEPFDTSYDGVEVIGDSIKVLVTLCEADDSLEKAWTTSEQDAFDAATEDEIGADQAAFGHIYRAMRVPVSWNLTVGLADSTGVTSCEYVLSAAGDISIQTSADPAASVGLLKLDDKLPIFAGFNYSVDPPTGDNPGKEPNALGIQVYHRTVNDVLLNPRFNNITDEEGVSVERAGSEGLSLIFNCNSDMGRFFEVYPKYEVAITVALTLPTPLRMEKDRAGVSGYDPSRRLKTIAAPGLALYVAHPTAIWSLDGSDISATPGFTAKRAAGTAPYGILRDDRDKLAEVMHLAAQWYLQDRNTVNWSLNICGVTGTWTDLDGVARTWPALGNVISTIAYDGGSAAIDGPITSWEYDADEDTTTWIAGFADLDWSE